jgi:DNA-binding CsgD family transcriptional regulator
MMHPQTSKCRSGPPVERASFGFSTPEDLDAHSFQIGSDEYVLLSFPVATEGPLKDALHLLTPSERDVVALALQGQPNAAIASARGRSSRTVANQLAAIYAKLGVRSRRELNAMCDYGRKAT